jgi:protein SCO1/2
MKLNRLLYPVAALLVASTLFAAESPATDSSQRSCCAQRLDSAIPLLEKSLYQLDTAWTNDSSQVVKLASLRGRPQVIAMFFASCQYTCPLLVFQMKQLEASLPPTLRTNVGFTLVSFDSQRDTPAALKTYRAQHDLSSDTWTLLKGDPDNVLDLAALLGVKFKQDAQGNFSHSNLITLLNAEGEIVYQQTGLNPEDHEFARRIEQLQPVKP